MGNGATRLLNLTTPSWKFRNSRKIGSKNVNLFSKSMIFLKWKFTLKNSRKFGLFLNWGRGQGHGSKVRIWSWKKKFKYQFFTLRKSAFMTYGQFPLKNGLKLRFVFLKFWESYDAAVIARPSRGMTFLDFEKDDSFLGHF